LKKGKRVKTRNATLSCVNAKAGWWKEKQKEAIFKLQASVINVKRG